VAVAPLLDTSRRAFTAHSEEALAMQAATSLDELQRLATKVAASPTANVAPRSAELATLETEQTALTSDAIALLLGDEAQLRRLLATKRCDWRTARTEPRTALTPTSPMPQWQLLRR